MLSDITGFTFDEDMGNMTKTSESNPSFGNNTLKRSNANSVRSETKVGSPIAKKLMETIVEEDDTLADQLSKS